MKKIFKMFLFLLSLSTFPVLCQASSTILSNASPNHTIKSGSDEQVYGTFSSNQIVLESGARAELINFPGFNALQFQSSIDLFTVSRSGTVVTFQGSDGTILKIPATTSVQTVDFSDMMPMTLIIHGGQVMLDDQEITTTPASIIGNQDEPGSCGAYVAPGVWKDFNCYNLAAIGKTTGDDPFIPSWRLIGGYWHWGRKGPDSNQWYNTNTSNFAHGPTGPGEDEANSGSISGWNQTYAPDGSWSDESKTANDPCPAGYRVPTSTQWDGVRANNTQSTVGTWSSSTTNYSSARFFGDAMMLPAAGGRHYSGGALYDRGRYGDYWSSTQTSTTLAWHLYFYSSHAGTDHGYRSHGFSVRCVAEDVSSSCIYNISTSNDSFTSGGGTGLVSVTATISSCTWITLNSLSWVTLSPTSGTGTQNVTLSVSANTGAARSGSVTIAGRTYSFSQEAGSSGSSCGAYVAPGVWKEFDCYNLAAIGKTTNDDPFTPSWRLNGGYWQWGRKGPDPSQWYNTNTPNFAHGLRGPGANEANSGQIAGWDQTDAPDGSWSDSQKTANDPCPAGYRIPTNSQWEGVVANNTQSTVGTWSTTNDTHNNYSAARFFGNDLMLPAAGVRGSSSGALYNRGHFGYYWSSAQYSTAYAGFLNFYSSDAGYAYNYYRYDLSGFSVRCVAE